VCKTSQRYPFSVFNANANIIFDKQYILDTSLDKVKIVAAAPEDILDTNGEFLPSVTSSRKLVVASEYKSISHLK
jgi:hypothetical protein